MGCHCGRSFQKTANYQEKIHKIYEQGELRGINQIQQISIRINNIDYQLVQKRLCEQYISEFQVNSESIFPEHRLKQGFQIIQHSNIDNKQKKNQLNNQKNLRKYQRNKKTFSLLKQQQDFFLQRRCDKLSLRSQRRNKIILILKIGFPQINKMSFDQFNSRIIYLSPQNEQKFICVLNLKNRNVVRQPLNQQVNQIVCLDKTNDFLVYIDGLGIVLKKFNCINKEIENVKILNYNLLFQTCIIDDKNLLNLISNEFYLRFDKDYNIIQKYKINFDIRKYHFNNNLIHQKRWLENNKNQNKFISEFSNYQLEYTHRIGRTQHLISSNEKYLAYKIEKSLIFHKIDNQQDLQTIFYQKIKHLNFSPNSNCLFVILENKMNCYRSLQDLKKQHQQHISLNETILQNNLILAINKQGQVKIFSKYCNKLIFRLQTLKQYSSFDFDQKNGIILISSNAQISLFKLSDREAIIKQNLVNQQCKMIRENSQILILTQQSQLQLWSFQQNTIVFLRNLMNDVKIILQGYSNKYCLRTLEHIIILDQQFNIIQSIYYQNDSLDWCHLGKKSSNLIGKQDQLIQENKILKIHQSIKQNYNLGLNILDHLQFSIIRKIILSLEANE